jgi:hypothetical protein
MSSEDSSRITLWGINNGYEENASNQAATIIFNRGFAKRKLLYCREKVNRDKNRTLFIKSPAAMTSRDYQNHSA